MRLAAVVVTAFVAAAVAAAPAQRRSKKKNDWRTDPYTEKDPAAMKKAGYASFGPFQIGDEHNTENVEQELGATAMIWVETDHFRIGSTLAPIKIRTKDRKRVKETRAELTELAKRLPNLKPKKVRELDFWLRLHLFAMRLEKLHAGFVKEFGKHMATSTPSQQPGRVVSDDWKGLPRKFVVLLFQRRTDFERYLTVFLKLKDVSFPRRIILKKTGMPLFATAVEVTGNTQLGDDRGMHCHVVFNVTHNLVDSYNGHFYSLPVWFGEGLAHWFARKVDAGFNNYSQAPQLPSEMKDYADWERITPMLLKHDNYTKAPETLRWLKYAKIKFNDHLALWSRVDFLMTHEKKGFGVFMNMFKGRRDAKGYSISGEAVFDCQLEGLKKGWGLDPESLETEWRKWTEARFSKSKRKKKRGKR